MNFGKIAQILENGAEPDEVLAMLAKNAPSLGSKIKKLLLGGLGSLEILSSLKNEPEIKKINTKHIKPYDTGDIARIGVLKEKMGGELSREEKSRRQLLDFTRKGISTGINLYGSYLGSKLVGNLLKAAPTLGFGTPGTPPPAISPGPSLLQSIPSQAITSTPSPMPPIGPQGGSSIPQPVNVAKAPGLPPAKALQAPSITPTQPVTQGPVRPESGNILEKLGIRLKIEKMRHQGHEPNMIIQAAEKLVPKELRGQFPVKEIVADYLSKPPETELTKAPPGQERQFKGILEPFPELQEKMAKQEDYRNKSTAQIQRETGLSWPEADRLKKSANAKPFDKGSLVLTPEGKISEVKAKSPTGLIVDEGGKGKKIPEADLEQEPGDVQDIVENILKIPEVDRSSIVSLFTFDPDENTMYIQYHNGETWKYTDVDPEEVKAVADKMGIPVTEGKGMYGAWSPKDKKSLGAALIQRFLQNPKYKKPKKGEPPNPNYKKLETFYDYWEKLRKKPKRKS